MGIQYLCSLLSWWTNPLESRVFIIIIFIIMKRRNFEWTPPPPEYRYYVLWETLIVLSVRIFVDSSSPYYDSSFLTEFWFSSIPATFPEHANVMVWCMESYQGNRSMYDEVHRAIMCILISNRSHNHFPQTKCWNFIFSQPRRWFRSLIQLISHRS